VAALPSASCAERSASLSATERELQGVVIVEHVLRVVRECCSRLLVLSSGKLLAAGPTAHVLASDEVAAVYLGTAGSVASPPRDAAQAPAHAVPPRVLLELRDVHAQYGQARVLHGISLQVQAGEVTAILGTNGAGKTSLAHVIGGLLRPSAGTVLVDGRDVTGWPAHRIARLGVAQCLEGRRIFPSLSVEENLRLPARDVRRAQCVERLERVYALFPDLAQHRHRPGTAMSGGQQQMLAIGRALMSQPRVIVFDEISLGLAPIAMDRLYAALAELKKTGMTLLIVEQDAQRALELADTAHVIEHGKLALSGSAHDCLRDPRLRQLYMGTSDTSRRARPA
jgi:branched-chain amino acid transport system ATP-binding protein